MYLKDKSFTMQQFLMLWEQIESGGLMPGLQAGCGSASHSLTRVKTLIVLYQLLHFFIQ